MSFISEHFPARTVTENLPAPPCPARGPEAGSHHTSIGVENNLKSGIRAPEKSEKTTLPRRAP